MINREEQVPEKDRAAREFGIDVANIPDYGTEDVADSPIEMMLEMTRWSRL